MRNLLLKGFVASLLMVFALSLGACSNGRVTKESVWADMSPEMETLSLTSDQRTTRKKRTFDTNLRQLNDDWDYLWLQDRPSYMSDHPVP